LRGFAVGRNRYEYANHYCRRCGGDQNLWLMSSEHEIPSQRSVTVRYSQRRVKIAQAWFWHRPAARQPLRHGVLADSPHHLGMVAAILGAGQAARTINLRQRPIRTAQSRMHALSLGGGARETFCGSPAPLRRPSLDVPSRAAEAKRGVGSISIGRQRSLLRAPLTDRLTNSLLVPQAR
jgi:hypothetical protein